MRSNLVDNGYGVNDWENPSIIGVNKRKAHVPLRSFTDRRQAFRYFRLDDEYTSVSPRRIFLNDKDWVFQLVDRPSKVPQNFWDASFDVSSWDKVRRGSLLFFTRQSSRGGGILDGPTSNNP